MESQNTAPNPVAIYNNAITTFQNGGEILQENRDVAAKIVAAGQTILNKIQANGGAIDPQTDQLLNDFIVKANTRNKEMNERRKGLTQMFTAITKLFTAEESAADHILKIMQEYRNGFARQLAEDQRKKEAEAKAKADKALEATTIKSACETQLFTSLRNAKEQEKTNLYAAFNTITLETFEGKRASLLAYEPKIGQHLINEFPFQWMPRHHNAQELDELVVAVKQAAAGSESLALYQREILEAKQALIDRLPSKKAELEQIAQSNAEEQKRLLAEQKKREEDEKKKREEDEAAAKQREQDAIAAKAEADKTMAMFTQTVEAVVETPAPETRQGFEIVVNNPAAWGLLFHQWFTLEGIKMDPEKLATKLGFVRTFCEKHAHKTGERIESPYLEYTQVFKAVNRRAKEEA